MFDLTVNLKDPDSVAVVEAKVRNATAEAEQKFIAANDEVAAAKEREKAAAEEYTRWQNILEGLQQVTSALMDEATAGPDHAEMVGSSTERALIIVNTINGATDVAGVARHMPDVTRKTVGWALWKLHADNLIARVGHGRYAPLGWEPGRPTTNYFTAGQMGLPTPAAPPAHQSSPNGSPPAGPEGREQSGEAGTR